MALPFLPGRSPLVGAVAVLAGLAAGAAFMRDARAVNNEPPVCLSPDPSQWPAPAKPYFMLAVDTSNSMGIPVPFPQVAPCPGAGCPAPTNCPSYPGDRNGHTRCALQQTLEAFSGQVNFGLASMAEQPSSCAGACTCTWTPVYSCFANGCTYTPFPGDALANGCGPTTNPIPGLVAATRQGGNILVPMLDDHFWQSTPGTCTLGSQCPSGICAGGACAPTNLPSLLQWVDNDCSSGKEIWASGKTPINGMLQDMYRYFAGTYVIPGTTTAIPTPLDTTSPSNERPCRSVNVILITAGDENCDTYADATASATALYNGFNVGGITWNVRTHVIAFVGGKNGAVIAGAGASSSQTGTSAGHGYYANPTNSVALSQALANIIGSAIQPETCDNVDNNCNGCTDEGFNHYCDQGQTCCNLARATCLANFQASITPAKPQGDPTLLPCTDQSAGATPSTWLCYNPGDVCDNVDNNCSNQTDEGSVKCGSPLHCPQAETCNGLDDDCNGVIDDGPSGVPYSICPGLCQAAPESCDGCDNDCNGKIDDGIGTIGSCGLPPNPPQTPAYCTGALQCVPGATGVSPGSCNGTGGTTQCVYPPPGPQPETCNGIDDNCNGIVDDGIPSSPCIPSGAPPGLVYNNVNPKSRCQMGTTQCINGATQCVGWIGPTTETCNGLDDNCDGSVDNGVTVGVGVTCGGSIAPCKPGKTACVAGAIVCQGGVGPSPEVCDGVDNDCNGLVDDGMLADAPPAGATGCWDLPGNCCSYTDTFTGKTTTWCPPSGGGVSGTCAGIGTLTSPCSAGTLACSGAAGWVCKGARDPGSEVCNGLDDNCNGLVDDGVLPAPVGNACGSSVGECKPGVNQCVNGHVVCNGTGPTPEICDGKDNDCNGQTDDNIAGSGVACQPPYDTTSYPGARTHFPCHPGLTKCDPLQGKVVCVGGVVPQPEVCDGLDNDCDGQVDEMGVAPDGITGTANPADPTAVIGQTCGGTMGVCMPGTWACGNGMFVCSGGVAAMPEKCDCADNDCNGVVDNPNPGNTPPLCSTGKDCVKSSFGCGCAAPCGTGEIPCPAGQTCATVTVGGVPTPTRYCVSDPCPDCAISTTKDAAGHVLCGPVGSPADPATCVVPPVCVCQGQSGCQAPCFGVTCAAGTVCTNYGTSAGKCVADTCFNTPCAGCGKVCAGGTCKDDPCTATSCPEGQECKPNPDFNGFTCVTPCGAVSCKSAEVCVDGKCLPGCQPACAAGQVCDTSKSPAACVTAQCTPNPCTGTACCDPVTGACGTCPCEGIVCPSGTACQDGQCLSTGTSSSSSSGSLGGAGGASGTGGARGVFGLATGGGGCSCGTVAASDEAPRGGLVLAALALAIAHRRRTRRERSAARGEVAR